MWTMDRPIMAEDIPYQHPLFINNSNNNHFYKLLNTKDMCPPMIIANGEMEKWRFARYSPFNILNIST